MNRDAKGRFTSAPKKAESGQEKVYAVGFKGFEPGLICRGKQYAENTVFEEPGEATLCKSGMHFCANPLDVLDYYDLLNGDAKLNDFATVEALSPVKTDGTKSVTSKLQIGAKLDLGGFIKASFDFLWKKRSGSKAKAAMSGDEAKAAMSGYGAQAAMSGSKAKAAMSGDGAKAAMSGYGAKAAMSGYGAQAAMSGYGAQAAMSGYGAKAAMSGDWAQAAMSGYGAKAAMSGDWAQAAMSGYGRKPRQRAAIVLLPYLGSAAKSKAAWGAC